MSPRRYSMEIRAERAARTRERIVDAALACYRERGLAASSLQAIARRADVSAATILNHFGSADALAHVVIERLSDDLQIPDDRGWHETGHNERVRRLVGEMFAFYERSTPWFELFRSELDVDPALRDGQAVYWRAIGDLYARVFGATLDDARARGAVHGLTNPATFTALRNAGLSPEHAAELIADTLIRLPAPGVGTTAATDHS